MIDVKEIFESVLLNEIGVGRLLDWRGSMMMFSNSKIKMEMKLSQVKIGSFNGSNKNSTLGNLYAGIHG